MANEKIDEIKFLNDLIVFGMFSCDSITIYLQYINSIAHVKDEQTEIMQLLKELSCNNEELKIFLKKALKFMPKEDSLENKVLLVLPANLQEDLEKSVNNFYMISKTLKELNFLASSSTDFSTNGYLFCFVDS